MGRFFLNNRHCKLSCKISVTPAAQLNELLLEKDTVFVGDAFEVYKSKITNVIYKPKINLDIPSAKSLNALVFRHKNTLNPIQWESLEPFYLRLSSPEE